jgi:hypothetical protein
MVRGNIHNVFDGMYLYAAPYSPVERLLQKSKISFEKWKLKLSSIPLAQSIAFSTNIGQGSQKL